LTNLLHSLDALKTCFPPLDPSFERFYTMHDGQVHDPLGAGSYIYQKNFVGAIFRYLGLDPDAFPSPKQPLNAPRTIPPTTLIIHFGAQPNNSPHAGTIVTFALAFIIARELARYHTAQTTPSDSTPNVNGNFDSKPNDPKPNPQWTPYDLRIELQLDLVDTAPDNAKTHKDPISGIIYQKSHRNTHAMSRFIPDYEALLASLHAFIGRSVPYTIRRQDDLMSLPQIPEIVERLVKLHEGLGLEMSPAYGVLAMRSACPVGGCGYAEKHGRRNLYQTDGGKVNISFHCPEHGYWTVIPSEGGARNIEFNTPLRNLVRTVAYAEDTMQIRTSNDGTKTTTETEERQRLHMRVTGADYSGFYQEQLLWRQLPRLSVILYAPLITDWSSSKLSKSLYVRQHAYTYLKSERKDYLLSWERMKELGRDEKVLFREVERWVRSPERLFRNYSVDYLGGLFEAD
ncbi:hypothetical protein SISNIDRAFT_384998, partial [Sistotremastrum niveocremeum HHB9708]